MGIHQGELLHYENITFVRDGRPILNGVNWHVKEGERWALLGLNGAGKTTLLGMIMAHTFATRGTLRVLGHTFGQCVWRPIKDRIGYVSPTLQAFQRTLREETVNQVILSGAHGTIGIYHEVTAEQETEAVRLMEYLGLKDLQDRPFGLLSTGEQRRTLIGRAYMAHPDLLILDEPCNGLDVPSREQLLQRLDGADEGGLHTPFVYVTHHIEEVVSSVTHVGILKDGLMAVQGRKEEVLQDYILSELYGVPVRVVWHQGRPWLMVDSIAPGARE